MPARSRSPRRDAEEADDSVWIPGKGVKDIPVIGDSRVLIKPGIFEEIPKRLAAIGMNPASFVIVSDDTVLGHYGDRLKAAFKKEGIDEEGSGGGPRLLAFAFPHGEKNKTRQTKADVEDFMLAKKCTRDTVIIALGGGVVGDLSGFIASTYMRGIPVVQIPTSTMAMIDSSVGGKTALNVPAGKNLIGAFHQPRFVFADPELLRTLSRREVAEGLAEAIKMGIIRDLDLFRLMQENGEKCIGLDHVVMTEVLYKAIKHKADVVAIDEKETGLRATLNYGHTIGHGIEALADPPLLHGECVSIGCVAEAELACRMGHLPKEVIAEVRDVFKAYGLPVVAPAGLTLQGMMDKMAVDKKNKGKNIRCTIITGLGASIDHPIPVPREMMEGVIRDLLAEASPAAC